MINERAVITRFYDVDNVWIVNEHECQIPFTYDEVSRLMLDRAITFTKEVNETSVIKIKEMMVEKGYIFPTVTCLSSNIEFDEELKMATFRSLKIEDGHNRLQALHEVMQIADINGTVIFHIKKR